MKKMLTIALPTYNRSKDLRVALDSVLPQLVQPFSNRVEVLISDNASTDDTSAIAREYEKRFAGIVRYRVNAHNVGFSRNVDAAIRSSQGEYVLLLGDDDGLEPNALQTIFSVIDSHVDFGIAFFKERKYDQNLEFPLDAVSENLTTADVKFCFRDGHDYIRERHAFPPFLVSGYMVRRDMWLQAVVNEFLDTICVHVLVALNILWDNVVCCCDSPIIKYRCENLGGNRWHDDLYPFTFYLNLLLGYKFVIRTRYANDLRRILYRQVMRSIAWYSVDESAKGKILKSSRFEEKLKELIEPFDCWAIVVRVILCLPPSVCRLLRSMVTSFRAFS